MNIKHLTSLGTLTLLFSVFAVVRPASATTFTFDNAASGNNADIARDYGSFIAGNGTGFITTDGSGATANIGLTWLGNIPDEWEYHTGSAWSNVGSPVHVLQMDHEPGEPPFDNIAEVVFTPKDGRSVQINSFLLTGASDQISTAHPQIDWEVLGTGVGGSEIVDPGANTGTVNVGFTGTPGESYTLRFSHVPGPDATHGSGRGTALDDLSISEVLEPGVPLFKLIVDRSTGGITLTNVGANAGSIKGYSITSAAGSLNPTGWRSIADNYDVSGNQSVDNNDNWTELTQSGTNSDLSEFEFDGDGGTIASSASVVLNQAGAQSGGIAWLKSPFEDLKLEVSLTSGASPEYSVEYVNGPGGGFMPGDLNFDNIVDALDWPIYNSGRGVGYTSLAVAYQNGDFDGDMDNDIADFVTFKSLFIAAQGADAWAALAAVPEPSSVMLWLTGIACMLGLRQRATCKVVRTQPARTPPSRRFRAKPHAAMLIATIAALLVLSGNASATTVTFATSPLPANNSDLPVDFGSFITGSASDTSNGFITADGTGATPNIGLTWAPTGGAPSLANVLEFHSGPALISPGFTAPILQFDLDISLQPELPPDPTIDFTVSNGQALKLNSLKIGHASNMTAPAFSWTFNLIRLSDMAVVQTTTSNVLAADQMQTINFNYTGDTDEAYRLQFDDGGANTVNTAIDDLSFSEVVGGLEPRMKLVVNATTGQIQLHNDSGLDFDIDSYEITSASGSLNPTGWNSLRNAGVGGTGAPNSGSGWDPAGGVDATQLIESYLLGDSTIGNGISPIDLGTAFSTGDMQDVKFKYHLADDPGFLTFGYVEYIAPTVDADFDNDGDVDGVDFLTWQRGLGTIGATNAQGDADGDNDVDAQDFAAWKSFFGNGTPPALTTSVPEPGAAVLLLLGIMGAASGSRRSRSIKRIRLKQWQNPYSGLIAALVLLAASANLTHAAKQTDRSYLFGDNGSSIGLDSQSQNVADRQDLLVPTGAGSPSLVNVSSTGLNRPGASAGDRGAQFDGVDDVLSGLALNRPDETVGPTFLQGGLGPDVFSYPFNYDTITARGIQLWVYPDAASIGSARQSIVMDTIAAGGVAISADGNWTQSNDSNVVDGIIGATVPVVGDQWYHVMQHIHVSGDPGAPRILSGQLDRGFTSVIYVDGVAVSANNGQPAPGERNDGSRKGVLAVGAAEVASEPFDPEAFNDHFHGVIDDLEMYVFGDNRSVTSSPAGQNYGTFDLFADNGWIADQIAQIPNGGILRPGDVNRDGNVNIGDENALVAGWMQEKTFQGAINQIAVGDWETWSWGDLNTDGIVNLDDAFLLDSQFALAGLDGLNFDRLFTSMVPEPSSLLVAAIGLFTLAAVRPAQKRSDGLISYPLFRHKS